MVREAKAKRTRLEELRGLLEAAVAGKFEEVPVNPAELVVDQAIYPRASIDMERVAQMAEALEEGDKLPPLLLASDRKTVIDGAHRTFAYRQRGFMECPAVVLPITLKRDVIAISMMANSASKGLPLRREDVNRSLGLLFNELKGDGSGPALTEQIKSFAGSLSSMGRFFGITAYRIQNYFQRLEGPPPIPKGSMPARARGEAPKEPEGPWGEPGLSAKAVENVLAAPARVDQLELGSPWDFVVRGLLKVSMAFEDLLRADEDWMGKFADALGKLSEEERTFLSEEAPVLLHQLAAVLAGEDSY